MSLDALEEIADQAAFNVDRRLNGRGAKIGKKGGIPDNLIRASVHVEREKKRRQPRPAGTETPPANPATAPANLGRLFNDYRTLIETCRARAIELELSRLEIDRLSGLPIGFSGKLLGRDGEGPRQKRMWPISLEAMLGVLGLKLLFVVDEAATARTLALRTPVDRAQQRFGNVSRLRALPPPDDRQALDSCAKEEATSA
jgi:hypothetical protein